MRSTNQDFALIGDGLVAVADGMGGHVGGEVAAQLAIVALRDGFSSDRTAEGLLAAAEHANDEVYDRSEAEEALRGMGTTLTAAGLVSDTNGDVVEVINIGDSRAYVLEDGRSRADHR